MTLADTPASRLRSFPSFVRRLAIALVVALVTAAAICRVPPHPPTRRLLGQRTHLLVHLPPTSPRVSTSPGR